MKNENALVNATVEDRQDDAVLKMGMTNSQTKKFIQVHVLKISPL